MGNNDLISRWAAIDALTDTNLKRNVDSVCDGDMNLTRRAAQRVIAQLPAVDAVPVVHGQWTEKETSENTIDEWQSAKCTNCGKYHTTPYLYYFSDYNFCPHCGAKMDEEVA